MARRRAEQSRAGQHRPGDPQRRGRRGDLAGLALGSDEGKLLIWRGLRGEGRPAALCRSPMEGPVAAARRGDCWTEGGCGARQIYVLVHLEQVGVFLQVIDPHVNFYQ